MILHLQRFVEQEQGYWNELEGWIRKMEDDPLVALSVSDSQRVHYLYRRASADLIKLSNFASDHGVKVYLENLISRAYSEIHETRSVSRRFDLFKWVLQTFPLTFRKHVSYFWFSVWISFFGAFFGVGVILFDSDSKSYLIPFDHLHSTPTERVLKEEQETSDLLAQRKASFSAHLMTHNTRVAVLTLALGMTFGMGTLIILFYNGAVLGCVVADYILDGQTVFMLGWLLPHGVIEIPAFLLAGQASFLLAHALIGSGNRSTVQSRLRAISRDLMNLIMGVGLFLIWAGIIEAFFSQYHEPLLPYWVKIVFGCTEFLVFTCYLMFSGGRVERVTKPQL